MSLAGLKAKWELCRLCTLHRHRKQTVLYTALVQEPGSDDPLLLIVGEAPGADEDERGECFVGRSGQLLREEILKPAGVRLAVFANCVCCRPPKNRDPEQDELDTCAPHLGELIDEFQPDAVLAVGRFAARQLLGDPLKQKIGGLAEAHIVHPAWLLRQREEIRLRELAHAVWVVSQLLRAAIGAGEPPPPPAPKKRRKPVEELPPGPVEHVHDPVVVGEWVHNDGATEPMKACRTCAVLTER